MERAPQGNGARSEQTPAQMREEAARLVEAAAAQEAALIRSSGGFSETVAEKGGRPGAKEIIEKVRGQYDGLMMKIFFPTAAAGTAVAGFGLAGGMAEMNALNSPDAFERMGHSYEGVEQLRDVFWAGADVAAVSAAVLALYGTYRLGEKMLSKKGK